MTTWPPRVALQQLRWPTPSGEMHACIPNCQVCSAVVIRIAGVCIGYIHSHNCTTGRVELAKRQEKWKVHLHVCRENLRSDEGAEYDRIIDINLSELEPHVNGPFTPDLAHPISQVSMPGHSASHHLHMEHDR